MFVTGCGHIGDGNVHITVFQPDEERRRAFMHKSFELAVASGGAISGEHGIGTAKLPYFLEMEDPVSLELMRAIKRAFDPLGHPRAGPGPGRDQGQAEAEGAPPGARHERGPVPPLDTGRRRGRRLLRQPGHLGDALRGRARRRARSCAACSASSRVSQRVRRTATGAWRDDLLPRLLHLGPGLGNGLANLHNARRARTPIVNIVGDHATYHARYDAPLQSDIASIARPVSGWYRSSARADDVAADGADAVAAAYGPPGCVATLVLPADSSWSESATGPCPPRPRRRLALVAPDTVEEVAKALRSGERAALLLGGGALRAGGLHAASRVAATTGAALLGETFPANLERGAGIPAVERLAYLAEMAQAQLDGVRHLILVEAASPVSFFAYPGKASDIVPAGCTVHTLAVPGEDAAVALEALAEAVGASPTAGVPAAVGTTREALRGTRRPNPSPLPSVRSSPRAPWWWTKATRRVSSSPVRRQGRRATTGSR